MLKVGQIVRVVNQEYDSYGQIAKIVDVDVEWHYPYELEFTNGKKYNVELYGKDDIRLLLETSDTKTKKTIEESIAELIERIKNKEHSRENALAITKLQEAKMWYIEGKGDNQ